MRVSQYIEILNRSLRDPKTNSLPVDEQELLGFLSTEVMYLSGEFDWDWAASTLRPAIRTKLGKRTYSLPIDFGLNFAKGADDGGGQGTRSRIFTITLNDLNGETPLEYRSPARFYSLNLTAESNARPNIYTIRTSPLDGKRLLDLSPPPDSNGDTGYYEVNGLYVPVNWSFEDEDLMLPIPGNSAILHHRVLAKVYELRDPNLHAFHMREADRARRTLMMQQARGRDTRIAVKVRRGRYSLVRGR